MTARPRQNLRRAPRESADRSSPPPRGEASPFVLQLAIGREGIGLELGRPAPLGCLLITEAAVAFPEMRFPLDVSGGVARFRHRRGQLERLAIEARLDDVARWAAPRLRGLLGPTNPTVWLATHRSGGTVGIAADASGEGPILAFDVVLDASGGELRATVARARGSRLPAPASALASRALEGLLGNIATREGSSFRLADATTRVCLALFPEAGARAPATEGLAWSGIAPARDAWILHASRGAVPAEPSEAAALAREVATLVRAGDDARHRGDYEAARAHDVAALERAPRHPEICARIAEIDAHVGGRAEAALATLAEAGGAAAHALLRAELLVEMGDVPAAIATLERAADGEVVPLLAARAYARGAELLTDRLDQLAWLDRAVTRAPSSVGLRWARIDARLAEGRVEDALADVEHVEAATAGSLLRYAVFWRAGKAWQRAGLVAEAAPLFERALRFVPDEPEALAGLGRALVARGRVPRGVALLARAVELGGKSDALLALSRALADDLGDRPAAVARAHEIPPSAAEAPEARALEGRLRAELGDLAGASLAYARLRQHAEARIDDPAGDAGMVRHLLAAAEFERGVRRDPLAAHRHLAVALRLAPRDAEVGAAYRAVGAEIARLPVPPELLEPEEAEARRHDTHLPNEGDAGAAEIDLAATHEVHAVAPPPGDANEAPAHVAEVASTPDVDDEVRVEELTRRLHANAADEATAEELVVLLMRLARHHELLALLQARLDDAPDRRAKWIPAMRATLEALEKDARGRSADVEAAFYAEERARLDPPS